MTMEFLSYRTRGNSSPAGKEKIYFTAHPEDFALYLDSIAEDILKVRNCAVYYNDSANRDIQNDSFAFDLSQMQLMVIPITARFLSKPSRARDIEFPLALEYNIPILPIMQQPGLEDTFNKVCGNLHILEKYQREFSTSYPKKLEHYLQSVLLGDELVKKVRDAFDAYIFLSYRKKDRQYAQELMKLIHKNDFCRDIAIWYDEFLRPGEDFNQAIREALESCDLFALVVTPNLVNETNYVMNVEYPAAANSGKPILPAEMQKTDQLSLEHNYVDIPMPIDARNDAKLREALSGIFASQVKKYALSENNSDPQHLFFIGLAYLSGIDVEIDHQKALSLITRAADAGLAEAMNKLAQMYQTGDGVPRDYDISLLWTEKLIKHFEALYSEDPSVANLVTLIETQRDYGTQFFHLAKYEQAAVAYENALSNSEKYLTLEDSFSATQNLAFILWHLFINYSYSGQMEKAHHYTKRLLETVDQLYDDSSLDKGFFYTHAAMSYWYVLDFEQARALSLKALEILEQTDQSDPYIRRILSEAHRNHGQILLSELFQHNLALEHYRRAIEIDEQINLELNNEFRMQLALDIYSLATTTARIPDADPAETLALLHKGYSLAMEEYQDSGLTTALNTIALYENGYGNIYILQKDYQKAEIYLQKALQHFQNADTDADFQKTYSMSLALTCQNMGRLYQITAGPAKALPYFTNAYNLFSSLCSQVKMYHENIAFLSKSIAQCHVSRFKFKLALPYLEQSYQIYKNTVWDIAHVDAPILLQIGLQLVYLYTVTLHPFKALKIISELLPLSIKLYQFAKQAAKKEKP